MGQKLPASPASTWGKSSRLMMMMVMVFGAAQTTLHLSTRTRAKLGLLLQAPCSTKKPSASAWREECLPARTPTHAKVVVETVLKLFILIHSHIRMKHLGAVHTEVKAIQICSQIHN